MNYYINIIVILISPLKIKLSPIISVIEMAIEISDDKKTDIIKNECIQI